MHNRQRQLEQKALNHFQSKPYHKTVKQFDSKLRIILWQYSMRSYSILKRSMDLLIASSLIFLLSPLFICLAIMIRLESPGSILFSQTRIGLNGRPFRFWKFRSMRQDAEQIKQQLVEQGGLSNGVRFKMKKDPRITRIGAVIRKCSIDELPQLWNVFVGDMSLVGPRPALPSEVAGYTRADKQRLSVLPGITCIWQVSGRSDIPFKQQVELDVKYKLSPSLVQDIKLLFLTIPAVVMGKGAY